MDRASIDEVTDFIHYECELLDTSRYEDWLNLFVPDGRYWVPLAQNQFDAEADFSLIDEDPLMLKMRVERLQHPLAHGVEIPIRTSRLLGNLRILEAEDRYVEATARFCLVEVDNGRQRIFAGRYRYTLQRTEGWRIKRKRVDLIDSDAPFSSIQILL